MLDANACINILANSSPKLTHRFLAQEAGSVCISSIAFAEVAMGSEKSKAPDMTVLEAFLAEVPMVPFDATAARAYAQLPFKRGSFDLLTAAHALAIGAIVVTRNTKDFCRLPGVVSEDWSA